MISKRTTQQILEKNLKYLEIGLLKQMILIDLQKAFDTINHVIMLKKTSKIGFSDDTLNIFSLENSLP